MAKKATKRTGESPPSPSPSPSPNPTPTPAPAPAPLTTETDLSGGSSHKMKLRSKPAEKRRIGEKENQLKLRKASKKKGKTKKKKVGGGKLLESKNKPKKPPTAFFYFLEDFRKGYQEQNPDVKSMRDIGKACGEKWKTMSYEEKVKYYDIATEKRAEFDKAMVEYNKKMESGELKFQDSETGSDADLST